MDSSTTTLWTSLFPIAGCQVSFYFYYVYRNFKLNANSVDSDLMPHYVASDLGLHCLPVTLFGVS